MRLNTLRSTVKVEDRNLRTNKRVVRFEMNHCMHLRALHFVKQLPKLQASLPLLQLSMLLDKAGLLLLTEKQGWRLENIVDGLGIDANIALRHLRMKNLDAASKQLVLRAISQELLSLLTTGTIFRPPKPTFRKDLTVPAIEFQHMVTKKYNVSGK